MKVTVKLAEAIQNKLQLVVGYLDLALEKTNSKGPIAVQVKRAKAAAMSLSKLVHDQTVTTVENSEACEQFSPDTRN